MEFLTTKEVQQLLRIGRDKAYALMHCKGFPSICLGHQYIVEKQALYKWIQSNESKVVKL